MSSEAAASEGPEAYPLGYVERLNDARTTLEAFFSILITLLDSPWPQDRYRAWR